MQMQYTETKEGEDQIVWGYVTWVEVMLWKNMSEFTSYVLGVHNIILELVYY